MALRSAWIPAPPPESDPAMVYTIDGVWDVTIAFRSGSSFTKLIGWWEEALLILDEVAEKADADCSINTREQIMVTIRRLNCWSSKFAMMGVLLGKLRHQEPARTLVLAGAVRIGPSTTGAKYYFISSVGRLLIV